MTTTEVINRLSTELETKLGICNKSIHDYITMAVVYGLEQRAIFKTKDLIMLDDNGKEIERFVRLSDATDFISRNGDYTSNKSTISRQICMVLQGKRNTSYGYHWRYA